ncbi:MAG: hypothetical protein ACXWAB_12810 [Methylobacter sp.]
MNISQLIFALYLVAISTITFAAEGTIEISKNIAVSAGEALSSKKFSLINSMADKMRESKERLPDGRWKLPFVTNSLVADLKGKDDKAWATRLALFDKWIAQTPKNSTPYLAKAEALVAYAWEARGDGWADSVKEQDWVLFRKRLSEARKMLEDSAATSKNSSVWFEIMQTIALGESWPIEEYSKLFNESVSREPTYYFHYFHAATYFLPRWHGSADKLTQFIDNAVNNTQAKEGQTLYTRIYWSLLWALKDKTFSPGYANWPRMKEGFVDILKSYPDNWNLNAFSYYACMAKDWATVNETIPKLSNVELNIWEDADNFQLCVSQAEKVKH